MNNQPLVVHIPHGLSKEEAVKRMKRGLARASSTVPFLQIEREEWAAEHLTFSLSGFGQTAYGNAEVTDGEVRLEVTLPWLLQRFARLTGDTLKSRTRLLLEKK